MPNQETVSDEQDYYDEAISGPEHGSDELTHASSRRRRVGRLTVGLGALLLVAAGFLGGVLVQKQQDGAASPAAAGGPPGGAGAQGGQRPGGQRGGAVPGGGQAPTTGEVKSKKGNVLYVAGADGNTVKVTLGGQAEVTRTAKSSAKRIHPGDTVIVRGSKTKSGQVKATSVTATATDAGGSGFPGGMLGGAMPSGGLPSGGGGGGGQGLPALPAAPGG